MPNAKKDAGARAPRLRALAEWYRLLAEQAGSPAIWAARIRTAEGLDAEAARIESPRRDAGSGR